MTDVRKRASNDKNISGPVLKRQKSAQGDDRLARIAEAKRRIEAKLAGLKHGQASSAATAKRPENSAKVREDSTRPLRGDSPSLRLSTGDSNRLKPQHTERTGLEDLRSPTPGDSRQLSNLEYRNGRVGLNGQKQALHPALLGNTADLTEALRDKTNHHSGKFSALLRNQKELQPLVKQARRPDGSSIDQDVSTLANPYFDLSVTSSKERPSRRNLIFNEQGKYIAKAQALRNEARLEELKKRIAESSKGSSLDKDITATLSFVREEPPEVEWWDQTLLANNTYDFDDSTVYIYSKNTPISKYIQHPIPIPAPDEQKMSLPKAPPLTEKEQKKKRRQDRALRQKDLQDKQKLGLLPAPPPKVRLKNMMQVLGTDAIKDPTAAEARIRQEVTQRAETHEQENEARKLNSDQLWEKKHNKQQIDAMKGIMCIVFRVQSLDHGKHIFQVKKNAFDRSITGLILHYQSFNLVVAEGGAQQLKEYRHLLMQRVDWKNKAGELSKGKQVEGEEEQEPIFINLSDNKCEIIWEGEIKTRGFHGFRERHCDNDADAKRELAIGNADHYWALAKSVNSE